MSECHCCGVDTEEIAEYDRMKAAQKWTREPPTRPGWYWAASPSGQECVRVVFSDSINDEGNDYVRCDVMRAGNDMPFAVTGFSHWAGPIEPPPMPEGT